MVMSMDATGDQAMSSSPPLELAGEPGALSQSPPAPFQARAGSAEGDEHEDEHSKCSGQTIVTRQQQRRQPPPPQPPPLAPGAEQQEQRMVLSAGSSFEDDDRRLMMNVDEDEEGPRASAGVRTNLRLEQADLEARLAQAKTTRFGAGRADADRRPPVESALVAQMRDIVEGGGRAAQGQPAAGASSEPRQGEAGARGPPKSSSDSLNNQNETGNSRASNESVCPKRPRHSRNHCRHHHGHHHHRHRHRPSLGGASLSGLVDGAETGAEPTAAAKPAAGSQAHHHAHHRHHHHHHHHHHQHGRHGRHAGPGSHQQEHKRAAAPSGKRLSLSVIEPAAGEAQAGQRPPGESNDSSMTSVSSAAVGRPPPQGANNPNQSKSSESPPSDGARVGAPETGSPRRDQSGHGHHHHHHHHHGHHHHHCHAHRAHDKRLMLETAGQPESAKTDTIRRRPLQDLAPGANISASGGNIADNDDDEDDDGGGHEHDNKAAGRHAHHAHDLHHHHHHHPHHHHHHHQAHLHHRHHHHGHPFRGQARAEPQPKEDEQKTPSRPAGHHHHHHHHHCVRHHRHHHHNGAAANADQAHHHQCKARGRKKSVSQTNVDQARDSDRTLDQSDEAAVGRGDKAVESARPVEPSGLTGAGSDEVVKMETSSPPAGASRRASGAAQQAPPGPQAKLADGQAGELSQQQPADAGDEAAPAQKDAKDRPAPHGLNQDAQANQENRSAEASQQQVNKLTRQMSSQSSRRSDKEGAARGGPGEPDGRKQSDHLRECAERALQPAAINQSSGEARQMNEPSGPPDRRCKLCWCCCCPCSALSARAGSSRPAEKPAKAAQGGPPSSPVNNNYPSLPNVALDEIRSWGESFDKLMKCSDGRKVFQDFLRCEYSEENILFWAACEELKKERDSKTVAAKARDIYEDYISILSSKEVSLDSRVRDIINTNIKKPTSNIFDEAQLQIYTLMHRDSYPRFINSLMYKKLAQIPVSNSRKSSS